MPSPPLALGTGHVALLLASGQLDGVVQPEGGPPHIVRGTSRKREYVSDATESGCRAGLLHADGEALDALVSEGIRGGHLAINGCGARRRGGEGPDLGEDVQNLEQYLRAYGPMLGSASNRIGGLDIASGASLSGIDLLQ